VQIPIDLYRVVGFGIFSIHHAIQETVLDGKVGIQYITVNNSSCRFAEVEVPV
jgi:hypothetical protein